MGTVKIDLDAIDDWKSSLGVINSQCIDDLSNFKKVINDNLSDFKGHTADVANEIVLEILDVANKAHQNIDNVQKTLTNVQIVKDSA